MAGYSKLNIVADIPDSKLGKLFIDAVDVVVVNSSFYDSLFLLPFALRSWGVVYLLFCNNIFLNIRIFFFAGARHFYVLRDSVLGHR